MTTLEILGGAGSISFRCLRCHEAVRRPNRTHPMNSSLRLFLPSLALILALAPVRGADVEPGFTSLFNGTDLTGWDGNPKLWSVQDGAIVGKTGTNTDNKISHNT